LSSPFLLPVTFFLKDNGEMTKIRIVVMIALLVGVVAAMVMFRKASQTPAPVETAAINSHTAYDIRVKSANESSKEYELTIRDRDRFVAQIPGILKEARVVPFIQEQHVAGYKVLSIVPEGFFGKLGFQEDDVLTAIDGQPLTDGSKALIALRKLQTGGGTQLTVSITRKSKPMKHIYTIR
jgi:type II secretory pathway component PulC